VLFTGENDETSNEGRLNDMGGGEQQGTTVSLQMLEQQRRNEAMADAIKQGFQQWGAAVARPVEAPQLGGGQQSPIAGYGQPAGPAAAGAGANALGPLFPQAGQGQGGGISETQLAEMLRRLGYG
jgi:hypothetical protein